METTKYISPQDRVDAVCRWIKSNNATFANLIGIAELEADRGNPCLRRGDVARIASEYGFAVSDVKSLRFNNNLWSVLARYMVLINPRLSTCLHFRKSEIDDVDMEQRWHEIVDDSMVFGGRR